MLKIVIFTLTWRKCCGGLSLTTINSERLAAPHFDDQSEGGVRSTLLSSRILGSGLGPQILGWFSTLSQEFSAASKIKTRSEGPTLMGARAERIFYFARRARWNEKMEESASHHFTLLFCAAARRKCPKRCLKQSRDSPKPQKSNISDTLKIYIFHLQPSLSKRTFGFKTTTCEAWNTY